MKANIARCPRVYCDAGLCPAAAIALSPSQSHYIAKVMRLRLGDTIRLFNSRDGEWLCTLTSAGKKSVGVRCDEQLAISSPPPDIDYLFAPLKSARLDYLAQKATEMGVRRLRPVTTHHTVVSRIKIDRLRANSVEAAEQCNLVWVPEVMNIEKLEDVLAGWDPVRRLVFCDEAAPPGSPLRVLRALEPGPLAVLVGPEGGFSEAERDQVRNADFSVSLPLGPRVMRADTASVAALALVQAVMGDWRGG